MSYSNPSSDNAGIAVAILCGGKGTRARPRTLEVPKPLMQVGDDPLLLHVMRGYAAQGFTSFVLAGGYLVDQVREFAETCPGDWSVEVLDTGADTGTAGRIRRCVPLLGERFLATYGDGLGDVDLRALLRFHEAHGGLATVTTVPLPSPYGTIEVGPEGQVRGFTEKPTLHDHWINAGFFVFERAVFDALEFDDLERDVLPQLAQRGSLFAFRHEGFWRSLDTYKDALELTALCKGDDSPWKLLPDFQSS